MIARHAPPFWTDAGYVRAQKPKSSGRSRKTPSNSQGRRRIYHRLRRPIGVDFAAVDRSMPFDDRRRAAAEMAPKQPSRQSGVVEANRGRYPSGTRRRSTAEPSHGLCHRSDRSGSGSGSIWTRVWILRASAVLPDASVPHRETIRTRRPGCSSIEAARARAVNDAHMRTIETAASRLQTARLSSHTSTPAPPSDCHSDDSQDAIFPGCFDRIDTRPATDRLHTALRNRFTELLVTLLDSYTCSISDLLADAARFAVLRPADRRRRHSWTHPGLWPPTCWPKFLAVVLVPRSSRPAGFWKQVNHSGKSLLR